ncbi:MAG: hypothetical protein ABSB59_23950 [Streptosporangiaceae bacterium]|jgi:hypothetical protein
MGGDVSAEALLTLSDEELRAVGLAAWYCWRAAELYGGDAGSVLTGA